MMEQVSLVRRGWESYPLAPAFRTNRTSWCALFDVRRITSTHSGCFPTEQISTGIGVSFDTSWLSLVSSETSCILSDPAVCSSPQHMPTVRSPRQCCSHHWKVVKTDLCKYFLSLFSLSPSLSLPLPLSPSCNSTNYGFKPRAFLLSASLQNMILKRNLQ